MKNKNDRQLIVLQILLCLIAYVMFQNIIMVNLKNRVKGNENRIQRAQTDYLKGIESVNSLERSYREYYNLFFTRNHMKSKLISRGEERYLGETITELSMLNNIKLSNIDFTEETDQNTQKYVLATRFTTDFYTLKNFLNDIDKLEKNINLETMTIRRTQSELDVAASFSIYMSK